MLNKNFIIALALLLGFSVQLQAQSELEDWNYDKVAVKERKVIPHRYTREANVKFHKRIHRVIDTREKQNLIMHWPRNAFYRIVWEAALKGPSKEGGIQVWTSDSLDIGQSYTEDEISERGGQEFVTQIQDPAFPDDPYMLIDTVIKIPFEPQNIKKYRLMEDWIFDYNYSDFRARIIAIAPLFNQIASGIELGEVPLFWVKMEDLRPILVNQELFNPINDAARMSFDDWFEMRMFSSYIVKESNVWDMDIKYFEEHRDDGMSALLESERIKNDLFIFEHDLWEY
jgi:gliding motility associated protien GldN